VIEPAHQFLAPRLRLTESFGGQPLVGIARNAASGVAERRRQRQKEKRKRVAAVRSELAPLLLVKTE